MDLAKILLESFRLLRKKPKAFIPRIITTALYSVVIISLMLIFSDLYPALQGGGMDGRPDIIASQGVESALWGGLALMAFMPALYFIDLMSYAMYPRIVSDYRSGKEIDLIAALRESAKAWKVVSVLGVLLFIFASLVGSVVAFTYLMYVISGNPLPLIAASLMALAMTLFFAIIAFFVVPSAVVGGRGVLDSFRDSYSLGISHGWDLLKLNTMFLLLIAATMALAYLVKTDETLSAVSLAFFLILRLVEAVVYTYLSVTNPMAYLEVGVK
ncbi:MAG: hypothetical protein V1875_06335 [Candidatus Altiarchaeota archaeon]